MLEPIVVFGIFALVGFGAYLYSKKMEENRKAELGQLAIRHGLQFDPSGAGARMRYEERFHYFSTGRRPRFGSYMSGSFDGNRVAVFDFTYTRGSGKNSTTYYQSVVAFEDDRLNLPHFALEAESFFDKVASLFGRDDIDFDHNPEFSKKFRLQGEDEDRIRQLFSRQLMEELLARPKICVEGNGDTIIFYIHSRRLIPEMFEEFVRDCLLLKNAFGRR